jgi:hypothetical protein
MGMVDANSRKDNFVLVRQHPYSKRLPWTLQLLTKYTDEGMRAYFDSTLKWSEIK